MVGLKPSYVACMDRSNQFFCIAFEIHLIYRTNSSLLIISGYQSASTRGRGGGGARFEPVGKTDAAPFKRPHEVQYASEVSGA